MAVLSAAWSKKNLVNDKAGAIAGFFMALRQLVLKNKFII